ncbi:MAG: OmpA family protein [Deltaproteobacteria bacterium]|jgi:chemotaxis protein MotB|nr:OmpA family protein [Deltaproteobacteria bacterium]
MFRFNPEESKNRLEFSEQKRTHLQTLLAEESAGEDTFVWSLLDLMTILLIFFIFIYTQSAGQINSISQMRSPIQEQKSVLQIREKPRQKLTAKIPIERRQTLPSVSVNVPESIEERTSAAGSISAQASQLSGKLKTEGMAESIEQIREDALKAMDESEGEAFSLRWNQHRLIFVLGERVTFPTGQAKLLESFQATLQKIASLIASKKGYRVVISGHTDNTPIKTAQFPSNWELSAARAISVAKSLTENGVDPTRVSIQGNAEYLPLYKNSTPANKRANRRVEITLIKEKS